MKDSTHGSQFEYSMLTKKAEEQMLIAALFIITKTWKQPRQQVNGDCGTSRQQNIIQHIKEVIYWDRGWGRIEER